MYRKIYINLLIHSRNFIKPFALYCFVKNTYHKNTIIYNYNYNKIAKLTGVHPKTAKRYINRLLKEGFCEIQSDNLHFKAQARIVKEVDLDKTIKQHLTCELKNVKEVTDNLYLLLIKNNAIQQEYMAKHRHVDFNVADNELAKYNKFQWNEIIKRHFVANEKRDMNIYFSSRSIGKLTSKSHVTALRFLRRLRKGKFLTFTSKIEKIKKVKLSEYFSYINVLNSFRQSFYFYKKGYLNCHHGLEINFM